MNLEWEDLFIGHNFDVKCFNCRIADDEYQFYYETPFPKYDYMPGKIIHMKPESVLEVHRDRKGNPTKVIKKKKAKQLFNF